MFKFKIESKPDEAFDAKKAFNAVLTIALPLAAMAFAAGIIMTYLVVCMAVAKG